MIVGILLFFTSHGPYWEFSTRRKECLIKVDVLQSSQVLLQGWACRWRKVSQGRVQIW